MPSILRRYIYTFNRYIHAFNRYIHTAASINFTAVEGGDNSSYAGSEAREVFINTSSDISGVNK